MKFRFITILKQREDVPNVGQLYFEEENLKLHITILYRAFTFEHYVVGHNL